MADNIQAKANTGSGVEVLAADDIGGVLYPRTKLVIDGKGRESSVERAESSRLREEARRNAVERAWQSVFEKPGVEAPPEKPSARQKDRVVAVAMRELDVSGLQASARELKRLINEYAIERHRQKQQRDAMILLLMSA
jgi:hypothetical protein